MGRKAKYSKELKIEIIKRYLKSIYYGIIDKDICNTKAKINKEIKS